MGDTFVYYMIGACLIMLALIILAKPLKLILRFIFNVVAGSALFLLLNGVFNISLGINFFNAIIMGFLGLPGTVILVAAQILL